MCCPNCVTTFSPYKQKPRKTNLDSGGGELLQLRWYTCVVGPKKMWKKGGGEGEWGGELWHLHWQHVRCGPKKKVEKEIPPDCTPRLSPRPIKKNPPQTTGTQVWAQTIQLLINNAHPWSTHTCTPQISPYCPRTIKKIKKKYNYPAIITKLSADCISILAAVAALHTVPRTLCIYICMYECVCVLCLYVCLSVYVHRERDTHTQHTVARTLHLHIDI